MSDLIETFCRTVSEAIEPEWVQCPRIAWGKFHAITVRPSLAGGKCRIASSHDRQRQGAAAEELP
jgi:hypothetical protein